MTIEEMKAKGLKRFVGKIECVLYTHNIEVYAKNKDDANEILLNVAETMLCEDFDNSECNSPENIHEIDINSPVSTSGFVARIQKNVHSECENFYSDEGEKNDL